MSYPGTIRQNDISTNRASPGRAAWGVALGATAILLPALLICLTVVAFQMFQWNLTGVVVFDQPVGWQSRAATAEMVDIAWNRSRSIRLHLPGEPEAAFRVSPEGLGLWVDPQATADAAYALGRGATPFADLFAAIRGEALLVMPVLYFDMDQAEQTLTALSEDLNLPAQDAQVVYQDERWVALPGRPGRTVDIQGTQQDLLDNAFTMLLTQSAELRVQALPPAISDLSPLLGEIDALVAREFRLTAYDPITDETFTWPLPKEVIHQWVTIDPDGRSATLSVETGALTGLLDDWEKELGSGRGFDLPNGLADLGAQWERSAEARVTIRHAPTRYTVSRGESLWSISLKLGIPMWYILDANQGLTVNNLESGMTLDIPSKNDLLPLPVVPHKRILIDISDQKMTVYENGQVWASHIVSTGMSDSPTMAGIFQIQTHEINAYASNWDLYMPHFMGIYEAWPGFMNGIHGLPLLSGGGRLWASALGTPASYGCIILNLDAAAQLYDWAEPGVVVEIRR